MCCCIHLITPFSRFLTPRRLISLVCDEDVKKADKKASQHEVECARIKVICNRSKSTMVSSILVDSGKLRMPAQNLLKTLTQRMSEAKKELVLEQQRVREEELSSMVHGRVIEEELQDKMRRIDALEAGVGYISDDEDEEDEDTDRGEEDRTRGGRGQKSGRSRGGVGFPTVKPPPSPLQIGTSTELDTSPISTVVSSPDNALVLPQSKDSILRLPKQAESKRLLAGSPLMSASGAMQGMWQQQSPPVHDAVSFRVEGGQY